MSDKKQKSLPPKLHKFMHPRNPYKTPPSFKKLALTYATFRAHCIYDIDGKVRLDFKNPDALRELTTCLLDQDFGLKVSIPDGRLVPTLPLRFNYLLWIEDLLTLSSRRNLEKDSVIGVDIGCGASCIYPLLGAKQKGWCMVATEADDISFNSATENVNLNNLEEQIVLRKVEDSIIFESVLLDEKILEHVNSYQETKKLADAEKSEEKTSDKPVSNPHVKDKGYIYDFTMCNPPFFSSVEETDSMGKSRKERSEPTSAATGALQETVTEGGEVAFIVRMIDESVQLKEKVRIFTTMIGSKAHVKELKDKLKTVNPAHSAVVEFCQGRTMRWGIAWTFDASLHLQNVMSKKQMLDAKPLVLMLPRSLMTVYTVRAAWAMINKWLHQLKVTIQVFKNTKYFVGANIKAYKPTWLHQRRKKRERQRKEDGHCDKDDDPKKTLTDVDTTINEGISLKRTAEEAEIGEGEKIEGPDGSLKCQKALKTEDSNGRSDEKDKEPLVVKDDITESSPQKEEMDCELPENLELENDECSVMKGESGGSQEVSSGLQCILKAKVQVKQNGRLISLEAIFVKGSAGKDGLNQILQFMRNRLTNPAP